MSTLLEQSIVDADALRSVALKNAEEAVISKYSDQIKEAVETLLEQPVSLDDEELALDDMEMGLEPELGGEEVDPVVSDMAPASLDATELCPCPEEEEPVILHLDDLIKSFGDELPDDSAMLGQETHEDLAAQLAEAPEEFGLEELLEKLTVDVESVKSGWSGISDSLMEDAEEVTLAKAQDTEQKEKIVSMQKAIKSLQDINEDLTNKLNLQENKHEHVLGSLKEAVRALQHMQNKLNETNLSNAKLLYTNKVLINNSLNERQKNRIVESLSKSKTVEEAKVIFDTLQSATGSTLNKKQPKSLSEAVNKTTSTVLLSRRSETKEKIDPASDRWKILAGINKK